MHVSFVFSLFAMCSIICPAFQFVCFGEVPQLDMCIFVEFLNDQSVFWRFVRCLTVFGNFLAVCGAIGALDVVRVFASFWRRTCGSALNAFWKFFLERVEQLINGKSPSSRPPYPNEGANE